MDDLILRPATMADAHMLLEWRNDPTTVRQSIDRRRVGALEHVAWLEETVKREGRKLFVAQWGGHPVGTGRLDLSPDGKAAELSLTVAPVARGRGFGKMVLALLIEEATHLGFSVQTARVRADNVASMVAFLKAGFVPVTDQVIEMERRR